MCGLHSHVHHAPASFYELPRIPVPRTPRVIKALRTLFDPQEPVPYADGGGGGTFHSSQNQPSARIASENRLKSDGLVM